MKALLLIIYFAINILASKCNELTAKTIMTYVISDSTVLMKDNLDFLPSVEVMNFGLNTIDNSNWIWYTSNFLNHTKKVIEFSKVFNIPGRVQSGKIEFLVDDLLNNLSFNGKNVDNLLIKSSYWTKASLDIQSYLTSGINYLNITVENVVLNTNYKNPSGLCFLITAQSEVFV